VRGRRFDYAPHQKEAHPLISLKRSEPSNILNRAEMYLFPCSRTLPCKSSVLAGFNQDNEIYFEFIFISFLELGLLLHGNARNGSMENQKNNQKPKIIEF